MSIFDSQYKKLLAQALMKSFLLGRMPNIDEITRELSKTLDGSGRIAYKYVPQQSKELFNVDVYNLGLRQIKFDIDLFYEELINLINVAVRKVSYADLYNKVHSHELNSLESELNNLLFVHNNSDFYFKGVYDDFSNLTKTDLNESTPDVVDLAENSISLPYGSGYDKVKLDHLIGISSWNLNIDTISKIVRSTPITGSSFSNMFTDTVSFWGQEVIIDSPNTVSLSFVFQLGPGELEILINRIEVIPQLIKPCKIDIQISTDNINYKHLEGYEGGIILETQKKVYGLDFETNLVQYVKITMSKEPPDSAIVINGKKNYQYVFGLRNLSFYKTGRTNQARYQSKPFKFDSSLNKISLSSKSEVPVGTDIKYSIALENSPDNFIPINPIESNLDNKVLTLGNYTNNNLNFTADLSGESQAIQYGSFFQGKTFYRIGPSLDSDPIFGSANLYRGYNAWFRDSSSAFKLTNVSDSYVSFAQSDIEAFYDIKKESAQFSSLSNRQVNLILSDSPYYNNERGHLIKPDPSFQGSSINIRPNYAIYSINQISNISRRSIIHTLTTDRIQDISATNINLSSSAQAATVIDEGSRTQYRLGYDYEFLYILVGNIRKSTGKIRVLDGSALLNSSGVVRSGTRLIITYTPDTDITHKAISISNNLVTLEDTVIQYGESILVEYRFIPTAPSEIIKSTIRVADGPVASSIINYYLEGSDYIVDPATAAIQRLANSRIPANGSVYVSFSYRNAEEGVETFQTWCYIPSVSLDIRLDSNSSKTANNLIVDKTAGEGFFVNSSNGFFEITNSITIPKLPLGWVQFIIRSKNPDSNVSYGNNLIDQIIQLRDQNKKRIFKSGGSYFSNITAFREPLLQRTLNHLKVNTLKNDHANFAIDSLTDPSKRYIIVNFLPNYTSEIYNRIPSDDSDDDTRPNVSPESFSIDWLSNISDEESKSFVVRIDLIRSSDVTDGGITPKVHQYNIRVSN